MYRTVRILQEEQPGALILVRNLFFGKETPFDQELGRALIRAGYLGEKIPEDIATSIPLKLLKTQPDFRLQNWYRKRLRITLRGQSPELNFTEMSWLRRNSIMHTPDEEACAQLNAACNADMPVRTPRTLQRARDYQRKRG